MNRTPDFPANPQDGFQINEPTDDGGLIVWTYNEALNQWTYKHYAAHAESFVYTDQVMVRHVDESKPVVMSVNGEPQQLNTQRDVNHYLNDKGAQLDGYATKEELANYATKAELDGYATKAELANYATKPDVEELQTQIDSLSGLLIQARYQQGTGITTRPGEFVIVANDTQQNRLSQGTELRFYEQDLDGKYPALTRIITGDTIHISDPSGDSCQLEVTYAAGIVIRYANVIGTLDRISDRMPYSFRISGAASVQAAES